MSRFFSSLIACLALLCGATSFSADIIGLAPADAFPKAKQPQLAVNEQGHVAVVFGAEHSVYFCLSADGGRTFSKPELAVDLGAGPIGMRRGPRIAATAKGFVITAIRGEQGKGRDEDLFAWRSTDGGKTWSKPAQINTVATSAREGLHHLAAAPDGTLYCVWLDLRQKESAVYGSRSTDGGATWRDEQKIYQPPDGGVCPCCQPQVAFGADGTLYVMFRNNLGGKRDMYFCKSTDKGRTFSKPEKLGRGTWPLDECPMDGGGLAVDKDGALTTIWQRDGRVFVCQPGHDERDLGRGGQGWAAAGKDGVYLAWATQRSDAEIWLRRPDAESERLTSHAAYPVLVAPASRNGPVYCAWEQSAGPNRIEITRVDLQQ